MDFRSTLGKSDFEGFLKFVDSCYGSSREEHAYSNLQHLLPHTGFCYGSADLGTGEITRYINKSFPLQYFELARKENDVSQCPLVRKWMRIMRPIYMSEAMVRKDTYSFTMHNIAVHGVVSEGRSEANWFAFVGLDAAWDSRSELLLKILTPHLNAVLAYSLRHTGSNLLKQTPLSTREKAVLQWLAYGRSACEIAKLLAISTYTVRSHVRNILRKLNAANIPHAIMLGMTMGLIESYSLSSKDSRPHAEVPVLESMPQDAIP